MFLHSGFRVQGIMGEVWGYLLVARDAGLDAQLVAGRRLDARPCVRGQRTQVTSQGSVVEPGHVPRFRSWRQGASSQFENNYFTEMCCGSEAGLDAHLVSGRRLDACSCIQEGRCKATWKKKHQTPMARGRST